MLSFVDFSRILGRTHPRASGFGPPAPGKDLTLAADKLSNFISRHLPVSCSHSPLSSRISLSSSSKKRRKTVKRLEEVMEEIVELLLHQMVNGSSSIHGEKVN